MEEAMFPERRRSLLTEEAVDKGGNKGECCCQCWLAATDFHWEQIPKDELFSSNHWTGYTFRRIFRVVIALYSLTLLIYDFIVNYHGGEWFTFYTHMNFTILTVYFCFVTIVDFAHKTHVFAVRKIAHLLFSVEFPNTIFLDVVYWLLIYPQQGHTSYAGVNMHGVNFFFMLGDSMLTKMTFVMQHLWVNYFFLVAFTIFAQIYHYFSNHWVYGFLDTSNSLWPLLYIGVFAYHFVCFLIVKGICQLREKVWNKKDAGANGKELDNV